MLHLLLRGRQQQRHVRGGRPDPRGHLLHLGPRHLPTRGHGGLAARSEGPGRPAVPWMRAPHCVGGRGPLGLVTPEPPMPAAAQDVQPGLGTPSAPLRGPPWPGARRGEAAGRGLSRSPAQPLPARLPRAARGRLRAPVTFLNKVKNPRLFSWVPPGPLGPEVKGPGSEDTATRP